MKVGFYDSGDYSQEIDLGEMDFSEGEQYREDVRKAVLNLFDVLIGDSGIVLFEDECSDCHKVMTLEDGGYKCQNETCMSFLEMLEE